MRTNTRKGWGMLIFSVFFLGLTCIQAQTYDLKEKESELRVLGTSNIHDWELEATRMKGKISLKQSEGHLQEVSDLSFSVKSESLLSGKSGMDKNTFKALKTEDHPTISFQLKSVEAIKATQSGGYLLQTTGALTIAGVTKAVAVEFQAELTADSIRLSGSKKLRMTQFEVEPPTALFGTIKTGDDIQIDFKVSFFNTIN